MSHWLSIVLLFLLLLASPAFAQEAGVQLHSVQANFTQEKHLKILSTPLLSRGTFAFQAPRSLRWEYIYPVHTLLLMHNGELSKLTEREGQMVPEPSIPNDSMQVVLNEITNWLAGNFTENQSFKTESPDKKTIVLIPKEAGFASIISRIELHLADDTGLMNSVDIYEGPDAYTRLNFSEALLNRDLPENLFISP